MSQIATSRSISSGETAYDSAVQMSSFLLATHKDTNPQPNNEAPRPLPQGRNPFPFRTRLNLHIPFKLPGLRHKPSQHTMQSQDEPLQAMPSNDLPSPSGTMMSGSLPPLTIAHWKGHDSEMMDLPGLLPSAHPKDRDGTFEDIELSRIGSSSRD